jgi:hypothetical protein
VKHWLAFLLLLATPAFAQVPYLGNDGIFHAFPTSSSLQLTVNPYTPSPNFPSTTQPFLINETVTGTCTAGAGICWYNALNIPSDNAVVGSGASGNGTGVGFLVNHVFGGAAMTGARAPMTVSGTLSATTGNTVGNQQYSSLNVDATANANDNGTGVTVGTSSGAIDAVNFITKLGASATNWRVAQGGEVDMNLLSGASVYEKVGWQIVQFSTDAVQGSQWDTAIGIANQGGAVGWKNGILFGGLQGAWPFTSSSIVITCGSPCGTATSFIDMSGATFSDSFLKGPGGFKATGAGTITSGSVGGTNGSLQMFGTTSGSATISSAATGGLSFTQTAGQNTTFADGGNGTAFLVQGAGGTVAARLGTVAGTTGVAPQLSATGSDTNISINLVPKGTGTVTAPNHTATAAAATAAAGQISYGGTTAAASNCGSLTGSLGCIVVNIAGATHYVPYY